MGSAFHQLCPRYSGTLTRTAPTTIRLWETFNFTILNWVYTTVMSMEKLSVKYFSSVRLENVSCSLKYSTPSMGRTLMARLPRLFRTPS